MPTLIGARINLSQSSKQPCFINTIEISEEWHTQSDILVSRALRCNCFIYLPFELICLFCLSQQLNAHIEVIIYHNKYTLKLR